MFQSKEEGIEILQGKEIDQYGMLRQYYEATNKYKPGSIMHLEALDDIFHKLYVYF